MKPVSHNHLHDFILRDAGAVAGIVAGAEFHKLLCNIGDYGAVLIAGGGLLLKVEAGNHDVRIPVEELTGVPHDVDNAVMGASGKQYLKPVFRHHKTLFMPEVIPDKPGGGFYHKGMPEFGSWGLFFDAAHKIKLIIKTEIFRKEFSTGRQPEIRGKTDIDRLFMKGVKAVKSIFLDQDPGAGILLKQVLQAASVIIVAVAQDHSVRPGEIDAGPGGIPDHQVRGSGIKNNGMMRGFDPQGKSVLGFRSGKRCAGRTGSAVRFRISAAGVFRKNYDFHGDSCQVAEHDSTEDVDGAIRDRKPAPAFRICRSKIKNTASKNKKTPKQTSVSGNFSGKKLLLLAAGLSVFHFLMLTMLFHNLLNHLLGSVGIDALVNALL